MEQIPVRADSPYVGRTLGDTKARTLTRCSVVAIIRDVGVSFRLPCRPTD